MNKQRRAFYFNNDQITKLQLMKAMEPDKSTTYSELVQNALEMLWNTKYKSKLSELKQ